MDSVTVDGIIGFEELGARIKLRRGIVRILMNIE
jgi:hypothetical protein